MWDGIEELKEGLQDIWRNITMEQVRERISKMPNRCKKVYKYSGKLIKSKLW
jgi:hypothetical protein